MHLLVCVLRTTSPTATALAEAEAELTAGHWDAAIDRAASVIARDDRAAVQAAAWVLRGRAEARRGEPVRAEASLRRADELAAQAGDDATRAAALTQLAFVAACDPTRIAEANALADAAADRISALASPAGAEARLAVVRGVIAQAEGRSAAAIEHLRHALGGYADTVGLDEPEALRAAINLGNALRQAGEIDEAEAVLSGARAGLVRVHGLEHLDVAIAESDLALVIIRAGRPREAAALLQHSIAIRERLDRDHPSIATARFNLARAWQRAGESVAAHRELVMALAHRGRTADAAGLAPFARALAEATAALAVAEP